MVADRAVHLVGPGLEIDRELSRSPPGSMSSVTSSTPLPSTSRLCDGLAVVGDVEGHRAGRRRRVGRVDREVGLGDRDRLAAAVVLVRRLGGRLGRGVSLRRGRRRFVVVVAAGGERRAGSRSRARSGPGACGPRVSLLEFRRDCLHDPALRIRPSAPGDWTAGAILGRGGIRTTLRVIRSPSDEALVAGLAAGDAGAATAFVRRFQARVFGLAVTMVGDPAVAEEIAQEAFTRAWRHAGAYDARRGRVATWLLSITRNLAIDHLRAKRTEPLDPEAIGDAERRSGRPRRRHPGEPERGDGRAARVARRAARRAAPGAAAGGAVRLHRARDRRDRADSAGDGEDPDPDRDAEAEPQAEEGMR